MRFTLADSCELTMFMEKLGCYDGQANPLDCEKIARKVNDLIKTKQAVSINNKHSKPQP